MNLPGHQHPAADLRALARRHARRAEEADDLLQQALLAAVESGRADLNNPDNRRWLAGVIRKRAAFDARSAARRRRLETAWSEFGNPRRRQSSPQAGPDIPGGDAAAIIASLSPTLRLTALLVMSGHTRTEIGWLLRLPDTALRKRISALKRALDTARAPLPDPSGDLEFGRIRRALLGLARRPDAFLASHDPDGHLFVVGGSQNPDPRQQASG